MKQTLALLTLLLTCTFAHAQYGISMVGALRTNGLVLNGMPISVDPVTGAGFSYPINRVAWFTNTPAITTAAYASNNIVGGVMQLVNAVPNGGGWLSSILVIDNDSQKPMFDFLFFSSAPTLGSYSDHAAPTFAGDDWVGLTGNVSTDTNYVAFPGNVWAPIGAGKSVLNAYNLERPLYSTGTNIWVLVLSRSAATFTQTTNLCFKFGIIQ